MSSIGDIVLTTPVVRCVKKQIPEAEIHFLVKAQFLSVVENNPYISRIHIYDGNLTKTIHELQKEQFDFIVDLHKNFRSFRIKRALGFPSASFPKLNFKKWLLVNLKINRLPSIHIVDRYFEAVKPLHIANDLQGLDYFIPEKDQISAKDLPEGFFNSYSVLVVGGAHFTKQIPVDKAVEICNLLSSPIVICGGKADSVKGVEIAGKAGGNVFNACGLFNLNQSASLIRQAQKVITGDTGLMHIAAAFGKPIISVWGNTVPEFGMSPYMPQCPENSRIIEVKGLKCRPCSKIGYRKCPKGHFKCMMEQHFTETTLEL